MPLAAVCLPNEAEPLAEMFFALQCGNADLVAKFNAAVDHGKDVHPSVEDGVVQWRTGP